MTPSDVRPDAPGIRDSSDAGRDAPRDRLRIHEIYLSLQGEGSRAGRRCTLVRLTACDLRCRWCDTEYAFTGGEWRTLDDVVAEVSRLGCRLVEITGGEPLLQTRVHDLIAKLLSAGYEVLIETGGHRDVSVLDPRVVKIMDLKAPGSGECAANRWENLAHLGERDEIKIVLADRTDYEWARDVVTRERLAERHVVLFAPVHGELDPQTLAAWIIDDALEVRLQLQLHKLIWGAETRGV